MTAPAPAPAPAPSAVTRKAITGKAIQFDGTVPCLLTIFNTVTPNPAGVTVTINFDGTGKAGSVSFSGSHPLSFNQTDWVLIPDDATRPMTVVPAVEFTRDWQ